MSALKMLNRLLLVTGLLLSGAVSYAQTRSLTEVYSNNDFQLTGISVSKTGRLFVNFPRWSDR